MSGRRDFYETTPGLRALAVAQEYVVTRRQLAGLDVGTDHVAHQEQARRWRTVGPVLVVLHRGPLRRTGQIWAAALNAGDGGALGSWSGLELWGLRGWARDPLHVVVRRGATPAPLGASLATPVVVHESRRHRPEDVVVREGLPVHRVTRCAVDAAVWDRSDRTACGVLAAVVQQRLTTPDRLVDELDQAGRVRRVRLLRAVLHDISGGSQALTEIDFVRFCREYGLPEPSRQVVRRDSRGRRRYLDVELTRGDGTLLCLEIDGIGHLDPRQWYDDLLRAAELLAGDGTAVMPLPATAYRLEPQRVADILHLLLR